MIERHGHSPPADQSHAHETSSSSRHPHQYQQRHHSDNSSPAHAVPRNQSTSHSYAHPSHHYGPYHVQLPPPHLPSYAPSQTSFRPSAHPPEQPQHEFARSVTGDRSASGTPTKYTSDYRSAPAPSSPTASSPSRPPVALHRESSTARLSDQTPTATPPIPPAQQIPPPSSAYPHYGRQETATPQHLAPSHGPYPDHHENGYHPPPPPPHPDGVYRYSVFYGPPHTQLAPALGQSTTQSAKKRPPRAHHACDKCRERKSRCDEAKPICSNCEASNSQCVYRDPNPPKVVEKTIAEEVKDMLSNLPSANKDLLDRLDRIEALLRVDGARRDTPADGMLTKNDSMVSIESASGDRRGSVLSQAAQSATAITDQARGADTSQSSEDGQDFEEHTTAAHKLLYLWPSIAELVGDQEPAHEHRDYVLHGEARGWLRMDGPGEASRPSDLIAPSDSFSIAMSADDVAESPYAYGEQWLPTYTTEAYRPDRESRISELRNEAIPRLFDLFEKNIHHLHPFIDIDAFRLFIPIFLKMHHVHVPSLGPSPSPHNFLPQTSDAGRNKKRKRSEAFVPSPAESNTSFNSTSPFQWPSERSLAVAITFLIIALGKIIDYQGPVPGPAVEDTQSTSAMPVQMPPPRLPYSSTPTSSTKRSPAGMMGPFAPPTPLDARTGFSPISHASSPSGSSARRKRGNIEEIPGLCYYREACSILGSFTDSNELAVGQARLLAGLYKGQLGRVQESWSWIFDACRVCRYQIRMNGLDKGDPSSFAWGFDLETSQGKFQNAVLLTSWSALQLESDILAELDYPHSGLSAVQSKIPPPRKWQGDLGIQSNDPLDMRTPMDFYNMQVYLRRRLNEMHSNLYGKNVPMNTPSALATVLENNQLSLEGTRNIHRWDDDEPPAENILEARVRAKFYGARYICLRPYLDYVLHAPPRNSSRAIKDTVRDARGRSRRNEQKLFAAIATMSEEKIKERARLCVRAACLSTRAFDNVPNRLIVTNIVGTGHAQFSNMLVLAAAHQSGHPYIRDLIPTMELQKLLNRTIHFLSQLRLCSPTATQDIKILRGIFKRVFEKPYQDVQESFDSAHSGDTVMSL